jgi:hypothetical protein
MFVHYINQTTTAAKMNPGLDVSGHPLSCSPPLTGTPDLSLADYIVRWGEGRLAYATLSTPCPAK